MVLTNSDVKAPNAAASHHDEESSSHKRSYADMAPVTGEQQRQSQSQSGHKRQRAADFFVESDATAASHNFASWSAASQQPVAAPAPANREKAPFWAAEPSSDGTLSSNKPTDPKLEATYNELMEDLFRPGK